LGEAVKGILPAFMTTLILVGAMIVAVNVTPVRAAGTIYIRADGRVEPDTAPILTVDNVTYTFTDHLYDGIVVERDDIVVDGAGYAVQGPGIGTGMHLAGRSNVTIRNMEVNAFERGIELEDSSYNTIVATNVTGNEYGIVLYDSSSYNTLRQNAASGNSYNLGLFTAVACGYVQDIDASNTVNGKPVYYWTDKHDMTVPPDAGYVVLVNCTRITVANLTLTHNMQGIATAFTTHSTIANNTLLNNFDGIRLDHASNNNVIAGNTITAATCYGIRLFYDPSASAMSTTNEAPSGYGTLLDGPACHNLICGNTIMNSETGIRLDYSTNSTVTANTVARNPDGIGLYASTGNTISGNTVTNSVYGIWFYGSYDNWIYHNNFIDNTLQVYPSFYLNRWDAGYPEGGNYWSPDYHGTDIYHGAYQNETGSDGLGDDPFGDDTYPLMKPYPWGPHDLGVTSLNASKTVVGQGNPLQITLMVFNYGATNEHFNATVYANTTLIHMFENVPLAGRDLTTLTFTWNPTSVAKGTYILKAEVSAVADEPDTADNTMPDGWVFVTIPGDVDGNREVNIFDIAEMASGYGVEYPDPHYSPESDIDGDLDIDLFDVVAAAVHYGDNW
jgi:parallel beta-helix repeat protein